MGIVQRVRELGRTRTAAPVKQALKRTIDLIDGTTFRARPMPSPEGPISSFYESHGYAIFRGAIERASIDALHAALDTEVIASNGAFLRHKSLQRDPNIFLAGTSIPADGLLDPHAQSETPRTAAAIESLLLTDRIADLLTSIDGAQNYTVHQTIVFFTPPGTGLHLDGWSFDTDPRGFGHTVWVPFEPVTLRNGPLAIVPWPRGKVVAPPRRMRITMPGWLPMCGDTHRIALFLCWTLAIWSCSHRPRRTEPCHSSSHRVGPCK
jgi:hypothetical protein